jgi:putative membrane protein
MTAAPPPLDTSTRLAVDRTRLAYERTLMAWIRTATSLISFGFTIYKFFQFEAGRTPVEVAHLISPRQFAMILIGSGLFALLFSTIEHRANMKRMRAEYGPQPRSVSALVAALVSIMGLLAFIAALLRA